MPRGRPKLPDGSGREAITVRLPPASAALLRALSELTGDSQADVIVAALDRYDEWVRRPPPKRKHAVVV